MTAAVVHDRDCGTSIVADASLYYRAELQAKLRAAGVTPLDETPSELILAAYRVWGEECVRHLEGDFAFVLWDERRGTVFCARDHAGSRPLFFTTAGDTFAVASTLSAARDADPASPLNHEFLAATAANLWPEASETACAAVRTLPAGHTLTWSAGARKVTRLTRFWEPRADPAEGARSFDDAALALRERLVRAVAERLDPAGPTSVWLSGGRDSSAVFAAGQAAGRRALLPLSISYPPGDPGREDETIAAIAARWEAPVRWLDIRDIPFLAPEEYGAAHRDEPYRPLYESVTRAAARGSRALDTRVALDGWGGDQLFEASTIYFADLLRRGRWVALAREWRALGVRDRGYFLRTAIAPALPPVVLRAAAALRGGRPLPDLRHRAIPRWLAPRHAAELRERQWAASARRDAGSLAESELHEMVGSPAIARVRGWLSAAARAEGIEMRFPLYDARVIALALARPHGERRSGRDTKRLLRAAMRGLLPDAVLAPRPARTGVPRHYFRDAWRAVCRELPAAALAAPRLADLGIVEPSALRTAVNACLTGPWDDEIAAALYTTLQTEWWLRSSDDGQPLAVLPPGKSSRLTPHHGGVRCTSHRSSSASVRSESSPRQARVAVEICSWADRSFPDPVNSSHTGGPLSGPPQ